MQPLPWWCSGQGCGALRLKEGVSIPGLGPQPLNNQNKVSWLKSERQGLRRIEKSRWCCGARCQKDEDRFPAGPRALLRWFQSGRNRLGKMKKVWLFCNWHGGVMVKAVVCTKPKGLRIDSQLGEEPF